MDKLLTKKEFLDFGSDLKFEDVPVPELKKDGIIRIRELTGDERGELESFVMSADGTINITGVRAKALSLAIINDKGDKMFTSEEVEKLGNISGKVVFRLYTKVSELSGMGKEELDNLVKNSNTLVQSNEDSISD